jgi:hypothetical protein
MLTFRNACVPGMGLAALALIVTTGATQAIDTPERKEADAWVDAHRQNLPSSLEALQPFSTEYRSRILNALPPEKQAEIWRARFRESLSRPLTPGQKKLLDEALLIVTPELYRSGRGFPASWREQVRNEYSRDEAMEIFESLGPTRGPLLPDCNCMFDSDCPPAKPHCSIVLCVPSTGKCSFCTR